LTYYLAGLESAVQQMKIFVFICKTRLIQTSKTGGQQYSDTSPFSIPWNESFREKGYVCVCVCKREREREREKAHPGARAREQSENKTERERGVREHDSEKVSM
jgi:hypothetical protein